MSDDLEDPRLLLRDGAVASVRPSRPSDRDAIRRFFEALSPEARRDRLMGSGAVPEALVESLCDSSTPRRAMTLLATRGTDADEQLIAVASYTAMTELAAEVSFAVEERFRGRGVSTLLLERLSAYAVGAGFRRLHAMTFVDNAPMREVFRDAGFEVRSHSSAGVMEVQLSLTPSAESVGEADRRRRLATVASLRPLLAPRSIAVIGASRDPTKMGSRILAAIRAGGFAGQIFPVHRQADELSGLPTVRSLGEIPGGVDLAVVAVPADAVLAAIEADDGVVARSMIVISAGFAELGPDGLRRQDNLVSHVRGRGIRMIGPNCMGVINTDDAVRLNASLAGRMPPAGRVALSSQSGALGLAVLGFAAARAVGLSSFVSVGNKADVSSNDLLEYWEDDPQTDVILLYLESLGNPRRFTRIARRVARSKPIVALKSGRTSAGSRAAGSHTAALAANDLVVDGLFRQSGVIRASTLSEMFDVAACLAMQPLPAGRRLAIVTNAGGPGILAVDACDASGLSVPEFTGETTTRLAAFLPSTATLGNPVDMVASADGLAYERTIQTVMAAPETDSTLVLYTPVDPARESEILSGIARGIAAARAAGARVKPVVACVMAEAGANGHLHAGDEVVPTYTFPENAVRALGRVAAYAEWRAQPAGLFWGFDDIQEAEARDICRAALAERGDGWLTSHESTGVLRAFGLPVAASAVAHSADEAAALASVMGFPVAAKLNSPLIQHKTDVGGVVLNLSSAQDVRKAFTEIVGRARQFISRDAIGGVLVQAMVSGGIETIAGMTHDPVFGPLIGFGIGGVDVEMLGDVRFRVGPLTDRDADDLLTEIRGFRLLQGYRGRPPADLEALREVLLRVSRLAEELPEVAELDLNPVMALAPGMGARIVDARIRVAAFPAAGGAR